MAGWGDDPLMAELQAAITDGWIPTGVREEKDATGTSFDVVTADNEAKLRANVDMLERIGVEQLPNALLSRQIEVPRALRADHEADFHFLFEDGRLALGTLNPQSFGDIPFRPAHACHAPSVRESHG
jgi:hypothetical protein